MSRTGLIWLAVGSATAVAAVMLILVSLRSVDEGAVRSAPKPAGQGTRAGAGAFAVRPETPSAAPRAAEDRSLPPPVPPEHPTPPMSPAPPETPVAPSQPAASPPAAVAEVPPPAAEPASPPLEWERPRFEERNAERVRMVADQISDRGVKEEAVLEAMRGVPRHLFAPHEFQPAAYTDQPLPIGHGQTISQPYVVAFMTELLELKAGQKVLEIGTGSGYQAAVLSELTPRVYTIEIIPELAESAAERFRTLGYRTIEAKQGDGYYGWKEHAPFDAVIVTAAAGHVPPPLMEQLKPGGRMVIPVGGIFETQHLVLVTKDEAGNVRTRSVLPVRFVPMTGAAQER